MNLTPEQKFNCGRCSQSDYNVFSDDIIQTFITWLEVVTCIKWVRSHENIDSPDVQETLGIKGQYGVIEIIASQHQKAFQPKNNNEILQGNVGCFDIHTEELVTVQLDVYRENGEANRNQQGSGIIQPVGSGIDVLWRIRERYHVSRLRKPLFDKKLSIESWGSIQWNKEERNQTWENVATQQIEVEVCRKSSIADAQIKCIEFKFCENEPKQLCDEDQFQGCD